MSDAEWYSLEGPFDLRDMKDAERVPLWTTFIGGLKKILYSPLQWPLRNFGEGNTSENEHGEFKKSVDYLRLGTENKDYSSWLAYLMVSGLSFSAGCQIHREERSLVQRFLLVALQRGLRYVHPHEAPFGSLIDISFFT